MIYGHSEFPAASYDAWKTTPPDYYEPDEPECDHAPFYVDYEGRAHCEDCGVTWWASTNDVKAYEASERRAAWRYWRESLWPVRVYRRLQMRFANWRARRVKIEDEIPF